MVYIVRKILMQASALFLVVFGLGTAQAEWRVAETANFKIYSGGPEADLIKAAERMEGVHYLLKISTGLSQTKPAPKLRVFYVNGISDVLKAYGSGSNSTVAGFYSPAEEGSVAVVPRNYDGGLSPNVILFHEYTHHFMLQYQPVAYPAWYVEGFAELLSTASFERKGFITFGKAANHRKDELQGSRWIPLEKLFLRSGLPDGEDEMQSVFYGQSWLLTHYLTLSDKRPGQLRAYINAINAGQSDADAFKVFGSDLAGLQREAKVYLAGGSFPYKAPPLPPEVMAVQSVRVLSAGEEALIPEILQTHRDLDKAETAKLIARLEALATRFPNDADVNLLLAQTLYRADEFGKCDKAATAALAARPQSAQALAYQAMAQLQMLAAAKEAAADLPKRALALRSQLNKAKTIDPLDPIPLIFFYETFGLLGKSAPDMAVGGLQQAMALSPQNDAIRFELAQELIIRDLQPAAMDALRPLAFQSHKSSAQAHALRLFEWLKSGGEGDPPSANEAKNEHSK